MGDPAPSATVHDGRALKIAYLILAHHKPRQFARLFDALVNPVDRFLVHVDSRAAPETRSAISWRIGGRPNVDVLPSRPLTWGGWSMAAVQLDAIRVLLERDGGWSHFANLSGQDFPLKTADAIRAELLAEPQRNHVDVARIDAFPDRAHLRRRLRFLRFERAGRIIGTPFPKLRWGGVQVEWKGSGWFTLSRAFCEWIVRDPHARRCIDALRHTYVPDEFLMQTLAMNGPFAETLVASNRREIVWNGGAHPETLTMQHRDRLLTSSADFARKFDEDVDAGILDVLAGRLRAERRPPR